MGGANLLFRQSELDALATREVSEAEGWQVRAQSKSVFWCSNKRAQQWLRYISLFYPPAAHTT